MFALYLKEVKRFLKVYNQTLLAPVVTSLLFLAVFSLALGHNVSYVKDIPFQQFVAPGLIMMAMVQNAFANSSSTLIMGKVMGNIIDLLMPPFSSLEIVVALSLGAVTRGLMVGLLVGGAVYLFIPFQLHSFGALLYYSFMASLLLALLGMVGGIISETFDQMAAVTSYVITPLAFLSGTFYSVHHLPPFWFHVSQYNPFFYMIDGFRYAITGYHDSPLMNGMLCLLGCCVVLWTAAHIMIAKGYRLKD